MNFLKRCLGAIGGFNQAIQIALGFSIASVIGLALFPFITIFHMIAGSYDCYKELIKPLDLHPVIKIMSIPFIFVGSIIANTIAHVALLIGLLVAAPFTIIGFCLYGIIKGFKQGLDINMTKELNNLLDKYNREENGNQVNRAQNNNQDNREEEYIASPEERENFITDITQNPTPELLTVNELNELRLLLNYTKKTQTDFKKLEKIKQLEKLLDEYNKLMEEKCPLTLSSCKELLEEKTLLNSPKVVFLKIENGLGEDKENSRTHYRIFKKAGFDSMVREEGYILGEGLGKVKFPKANEYKPRLFTGFPQKLFDFITRVREFLKNPPIDPQAIIREKRLQKFSKDYFDKQTMREKRLARFDSFGKKSPNLESKENKTFVTPYTSNYSQLLFQQSSPSAEQATPSSQLIASLQNTKAFIE